MTHDRIADYRVVLDIFGDACTGISDADLDGSTPCADWTLRTLISHSFSAMQYYARLAREGDADLRETAIRVDSSHEIPAHFDAESRDALDAWSAPGALDRTVQMVIGRLPGAEALAIHTADLAVHAWDVAAARGRTLELPGDLADACLATWTRVVERAPLRGNVFADEVEVPPAATPTERLVAFCGRTP